MVSHKLYTSTNNGIRRTMGEYNNNGISQYGNSQDGTLFCLHQEASNKLSYNGIKLDSSVWRDVRSCSGGGSGNGDGIIRLRDRNKVWRVSPDI